MADKWNVEICIEHITQLKSPFENMGNGKFSRLGRKVKKAVNKLRLPRPGD